MATQGSLERARELRPKIINTRGIVASEQVIAEALDAAGNEALEKAAIEADERGYEKLAAAIRAMKEGRETGDRSEFSEREIHSHE